MRVLVAVLVLGALGAAAGCGGEEREAPAALPPSGIAYRMLNDADRLAVAESCRDRAAARADGAAANELGRVDPRALREELDAGVRAQTSPAASRGGDVRTAVAVRAHPV